MFYWLKWRNSTVSQASISSYQTFVSSTRHLISLVYLISPVDGLGSGEGRKVSILIPALIQASITAKVVHKFDKDGVSWAFPLISSHRSIRILTYTVSSCSSYIGYLTDRSQAERSWEGQSKPDHAGHRDVAHFRSRCPAYLTGCTPSASGKIGFFAAYHNCSVARLSWPTYQDRRHSS